MNGPAHFKKAEEILANIDAARDHIEGKFAHPAMAAQMQAALLVETQVALVHATLAHTAAVADAAHGQRKQTWNETLQ